ncbi:hypothetical protein [Mycobacterium sp.]|uniref:hypothetical protein n=1 Tax=Mycobacterium sp. TaxID=1785 RepID=UPI00126C4CDA|nr:hypothetical protein [Mycobacterium sp.]KAA8964466.1 MAG: hypothetical protein F6Q13_09885 [Mycobacterium sp.]
MTSVSKTIAELSHSGEDMPTGRRPAMVTGTGERRPIIAGTTDERNVTAQELYKAIRAELEKLQHFSGSSTNELERLAHAYAMVSDAVAPRLPADDRW